MDFVWHLALLLSPALFLAAACSNPDGGNTGNNVKKLTPEEYKKLVEQAREKQKNFLNALLLLNSKSKSDWVLSKQMIDSMNLHLNDAEAELVSRITDETVEGEDARKQLFEYASIVKLTLAFSEGYNPITWKDNFNRIVALGERGKMILAETLVWQLGKKYAASYQSEVRYYLVQLGEDAFRLLKVYLEELLKTVPDTLLYAIPDTLVQTMACVASFGTDGTLYLEQLFKSTKNQHIKKACLLAFAEINDVVKGIEFIQIVLNDDDHLMHQAAYYALSDYSILRTRAFDILKSAFARESDVFCKRQIINTFGSLRLFESIDLLVGELRNPDTRNFAIIALKKITGLAIDDADKWHEWYEKNKPSKTDEND